MNRFLKITAALLLLVAMAACRTQPLPTATQAPEEQPTVTQAPEEQPIVTQAPEEGPNYTVEDEMILSETINGLDIEVRLPRVVHVKNSQIEAFYREIVESVKTMLQERRSGVDAWYYDDPATEYIDSYINYEVRQAKGLVCVYVYRGDFVLGLVFDEDGTLYSDDDVFALYGITIDEANAAIEGTEYDEGVLGCFIYSEDTMLCVARTGGDLAHSYLVTKSGGTVRAWFIWDE